MVFMWNSSAGHACPACCRAARTAAFGCLVVLSLSGCSRPRTGSRSSDKPKNGEPDASASKAALSYVGEKDRILVPQDAYTQRDFSADQRKWARRTMGEAYGKVGLKNPVWDKDALSLLELAVPIAETQSTDTPTTDRLLAACKPLMNSRCNDPLIQSVIGYSLWLKGRKDEAEPYLKRSIEGFNQVKYCRALGRLAPMVLGAICKDSKQGREQEADQWFNLAVKYIGETAHDDSYPGEERRLFYEKLRHDLGGYLESKGGEVYRAITSKPGADPWIVEIVAGEAEIDEAWKCRGSGAGYEVTGEGIKGFYKHLHLAQKHLTRAWKMHPRYPEAPARMITVAMGLGGDNAVDVVRVWFNRAVVWHFDYQTAYEHLLYAISPRWLGSHEGMYQFGSQCLGTKRFDTGVPEYFLRAIMKINEEGDEPQLWNRPGMYEDLRSMFQGYVAQDSSPQMCHKWKSYWAAVAWRCQKYEEAKRLFEEIGPKVDSTIFDKLAVSWEMAAGETRARTGPMGKEIQAAETACEQGNARAALSVFAKAQGTTRDKLALTFLRDRCAALRMESAFSGTRWTDLTPPQDLAGWRQAKGTWFVENKGASKSVYLLGNAASVCTSRIPADVELRGEIEADPGAHYYADISLGVMESSLLGMGTTVRVCHWGEQKIELYKFNDVLQREAVVLKDRNTFLIQQRNSHVTVYLNGTPVISNAEVEPYGNAQIRPWIGLQTSQNDDSTSVRYRGLQLRKLASQPAARR